MKNLFITMMALIFSGHLCASPIEKPITLDFDRVPVVDLVNVVYGDILKTNYAIDPAIFTKGETVTVHFRDSNKNHLADYMQTLLDSIGLQVEQKSTHVIIKQKNGDSERELFYYRPKHRTADYLLGLITTIFDRGRFSGIRGVRFGPTDNPATSTGVPVDQVASNRETPSAQTEKPSSAPYNSPSDSDSGADSFIYEGNAKEIDRLSRLLQQIDSPAGEVLIKAIVYEVGTTGREGNAAGLAVDILNGKLGFKVGTIHQQGASTVSLKAGGIEAIFSALNTDSRFRVVSSPSLRVRSGARGVVSVGADYPVPAVSYDRNGNPIQTVQYKASGVILDLRPTVTDERVDLYVKQQISAFLPVATGSGGVPVLSKREFSTTVGMLPDEVILLGGLDENKSTGERSGLPFLPDWLHSRSNESVKTEILLVLQVQKI